MCFLNREDKKTAKRDLQNLFFQERESEAAKTKIQKKTTKDKQQKG